ncbi:hypothetical protein BJP07_05220 [Corynebacterium sp. NML130628]|nr:hypothetical protein BJP07_05220 [Corynebacterium sp. NML130628]
MAPLPSGVFQPLQEQRDMKSIKPQMTSSTHKAWNSGVQPQTPTVKSLLVKCAPTEKKFPLVSTRARPTTQKYEKRTLPTLILQH